MSPSMCISIEQLMLLRCDQQTPCIYSEHNKFVFSWVNHRILSITPRIEMSGLTDTGKMLSLLWEHQMLNLKEWHSIQIALNGSGCICFLCNVYDSIEEKYDHIMNVTKMIEDVFQLKLRKIKY
jgi:hypothetical protein